MSDIKIHICTGLGNLGLYKEAQNQVELFHGSGAGPNNETLQSFRNQGAVGNIAQGYGQGAGFYVFTDFETAAKQATHKDFIKGGWPIVISVMAELTPKDFDMDYEVQGKQALYVIRDNWDLFKQIPDSEIVFRGNKLLLPSISETKTTVPKLNPEDKREKLILRYYDPDRYIRDSRPDSFPNVTFALGLGDKGIRDGEIVGKIMNKLQQMDSSIFHQWENEMFQNLKPRMALKYVGQDPLPIHRIWAFVENEWVDVTEQDPEPNAEIEPADPTPWKEETTTAEELYQNYQQMFSGKETAP